MLAILARVIAGALETSDSIGVSRKQENKLSLPPRGYT
jgi:hypothetical protein